MVPECGMGGRGDLPVAPLIPVDAADIIANRAEIGHGELLPRHQLCIPCFRVRIEAVGIDFGGNPAITRPGRKRGVPMPVVVQHFDPRPVGRRREHRIPLPGA